jgi:hypothetical protein
MRRILTLMAAAALAGGVAQAQWLTQEFALKAGWNAVFLHVDASHTTLDQMAAADPNGNIEEVWLWKPDLSAQQFVDSPQSPLATDTRWLSWTRTPGPSASLTSLAPNFAYLVKVKASVPTYTWSVQGKPVAPNYQWTTSGLNFLGFPTDSATPPTFDSFLSQAPAEFRRSAEFYRYPGGNLGAGNPAQVFALRTTSIRRGEAYWIKSGDYFNRYFGPFEVSVSGSGQVKFGDSLKTAGIRINNLTAAPLTVRLGFKASETAPAGQPVVAGPVPLLVRGARNSQNGKYAYTKLDASTPATYTLAAAGADGSSIEVVLGADRSAMTGTPGALLAGVLQFSDGNSQSRIDVAVSALVGDYTGLWVGNAAVDQVAQYLKKFATDSAGNVAVNADGTYQITSTNTSLAATKSAYPMRLIVHNPTSGAASLYQRVFTGLDPQTNAVVANSEAVLDRTHLADARRISSPHLPFTKANTGWTFNGLLSPSAKVTASVTNRFDDGTSNPFVHTYHPDHDNLNARFTQTLPQGSESYTVVRDITLQFTPPSDDFVGRTSVGQVLGGVYGETIRVLGLARGGGNADTRTFEVRGDFVLNRLAMYPVVTKAP